MGDWTNFISSTVNIFFQQLLRSICRRSLELNKFLVATLSIIETVTCYHACIISLKVEQLFFAGNEKHQQLPNQQSKEQKSKLTFMNLWVSVDSFIPFLSLSSSSFSIIGHLIPELAGNLDRKKNEAQFDDTLVGNIEMDSTLKWYKLGLSWAIPQFPVDSWVNVLFQSYQIG